MSEIESVESFAKQLQRENKSTSTVDSYKSIITRFLMFILQEKGIITYTKEDVILYLTKLRDDGMSKKTIKKSISAINLYSQFINSGIEIKTTELTFLNELEDSEPIYYILSHEVQEQMYKYAKRVWKKRNIAMNLILLETGIKLSELISLNKDDVVTINDSHYIMVNRKNNRMLPITEDLYSVLQHYLNSRMDHFEPLFVSNLGNRIGERSIQLALKMHGDRLTTQVLRDTFIFNLLSKDVDTFLISELAGITYSDTFIEKYVKRTPQFINEFIEVTDIRDPNLRTKRITFDSYEDLKSFVKEKENQNTVFYEQFLPYTEQLKVEITEEATYLEVFVTVLPTSMETGNQVLVSIPAWKYSFLGPIAINNVTIKEQLNEAHQKVSTSIERISVEIAEGINKIFNNIMNLLKNG